MKVPKTVVIFVSRNAVEFALARCTAAELSQHEIFAVGPGTAGALAAHFAKLDIERRIITPQRLFSSKGLLQLPELSEHNIAQRQVVIVRGCGGREILAEALRERGAAVDYWEVYERVLSRQLLARELRKAGVSHPSIGVVTSVQGLTNLAEKISREGLQSLYDMPILVPGERIGAQISKLGFTNPPVIADNPTDEDIVARLERWITEKL